MADYPLLIFPGSARAERAKRRPGFGRIRAPDSQSQASRLVPQFRRLQLAMEQHRLAIQGTSLGIQPEQVMVLETIGPISNFINAVKRIQGLEWLGELELDDIDPEYGFKDERDPEKKLKGHLFLVMTDQRALREFQSLFDDWHRNTSIDFPRGLAPLKHAFEHLYRIRPWDSEDRIRDTGILEDWRERDRQGQEAVPFEVELWYRQNPERQRQAEAYLASIVRGLGGEVVSQCVIPEIAYHGVMGRIPIRELAGMLVEVSSLREFRLLQCEDIMHVRPLGQCTLRVVDDLSQAETAGQERMPALPQGDPVIALFDGLPLTRHRLLDGRLIVDDPDGYESNYQARERIHGTAMASLICHGDLDLGEQPIIRPVYVRPIMLPTRGFDGDFHERVPEGVLPVDLIHRAVRRLYEAEAGQPPVAESIRVINLCVCDQSRPFVRSMSSWARLLDWLSWNYRVLFVVSAGNHSHDIELNVPRNDLLGLSAQDRERAVIEAIAADTRNRRLLSPSETINGLTIGATHADGSTPLPNPNFVDPLSRPDLPSTICAHGPGYRRAVKPDILLPGGRQFLTEKMGNMHPNAFLRTAFSNNPPGQGVAVPGPRGELDRTCHSRGTSNSAAIASRSASFLLGMIEMLRAQEGVAIDHQYDVVLTKALLVHGSEWHGAGDVYRTILRNAQNSRTLTDYIGRFLGYGLANVQKVMVCTDQRVTVIGVGQLEDGEADEFFFPLPPSLSAVTHKRRLTLTLAWLSPINCSRQNYRIAQLWFDPKNNLAPERIDAHHDSVQRGTVQHEVLESEEAVDFQDGDGLLIKVNCRADAGDIPEPIRYALAATLEVAPGIQIPIYQEVRDRLRIRVPIPGQGTAT